MSKKIVIVAMAMGVMMAFLIPPFQVMDEQRHYVRAGAMAEGKFRCESGWTEISEKKLKLIEFAEMERITFRRDEKWSLNKTWEYREPNDANSKIDVWTNGCLIPGIAYAIPAAGIWVGDLLNNQLAGFYLGRLANLMMAISMVGATMWLAARSRVVLGWLMVLPTTMLLLGSVSYDAMIIPGSMLLTGLAQIRREMSERLGIKLAIGMGLMAGVITALKPVYAPLLLGLLILPWLSRGKGWWVKMGIAVVSMVAVVWVMRVGGAKEVLTMPLPQTQGRYFLETDAWVREQRGWRYDSSAQLQKVLESPGEFGMRVLTTVKTVGLGYVASMMGILGWGNTGVDLRLVAWMILGGVGALVLSEGGERLKRWKRIIIASGVLATVGLIALVFYIVETPGSSPIIVGIQGRYFTPLIYPASLVLTGSKGSRFSRWKKMIMGVYVGVVIVGALAGVWARYYQG